MSRYDALNGNFFFWPVIMTIVTIIAEQFNSIQELVFFYIFGQNIQSFHFDKESWHLPLAYDHISTCTLPFTSLAHTKKKPNSHKFLFFCCLATWWIKKATHMQVLCVRFALQFILQLRYSIPEGYFCMPKHQTIT